MAQASGSHHRPYEGQQRYQGILASGASLVVIIAPTRGSNLLDDPEIQLDEIRHHRPYEGQQQLRHVHEELAAAVESSSPLRGA